jgi:hypothetical protein
MVGGVPDGKASEGAAAVEAALLNMAGERLWLLVAAWLSHPKGRG